MNIKTLLKNKKAILQLILLFFFGVGVFLIASRIHEVLKFGARAAEPMAEYFFNPISLDNLQQGEIRNVEVWVDANIDPDHPGEINGIEFEINFDPSKINIVDQDGIPINPEDQDGIQIADQTGGLFNGLSVFPAANSVLNADGTIYLSVAVLNGSYSGPAIKTASFYIKALVNSGSSNITFREVLETDGVNSNIDHMNIYMPKPGEDPPTADIISKAEMDDFSGLPITFTGAGVPSLSLTTPDPNLNVGDTFDVDIEVDTLGQDTMGIDAYLQYDSADISIRNIQAGSIYPQGNYQGLDLPPEGGIVGFEISSFVIPNGDSPYNSNTNPDHVFATIEFQAVGEGITNLEFIFDGFQQSTTDSNMLKLYDPGTPITESDDILEQVNNLTLNITSIGPSPSPSPSSSPGPSPGDGLIIDNYDDLNSRFFPTGDWTLYEQSGISSHFRDSHHYTPVNQGQDGDTAVWSFSVPQTGNYQVSTYIWGCDDANYHCWRPADAPYTINYEGGSQTILVNQRESIQGWKSLGTYYFVVGNTYSVALTDTGIDLAKCLTEPYLDKCDLIADAIQLIPTGVSPSPLPSPSPSSSSSPSPSPSPSADPCSVCPANMTCDENPLTVDAADLSIIIAGWGIKFHDLLPTCNGCPRDLNGDGKINAADIQILISWWGWGVTW